LAGHRDWLASETLAVELVIAQEAELAGSEATEEVQFEDGPLRLAVRRA
jgi:hypothetical protein